MVCVVFVLCGDGCVVHMHVHMHTRILFNLWITQLIFKKLVWTLCHWRTLHPCNFISYNQ